MGANTKIEWAHHTFNPVVGCTKVSAACDHCYAEGWARRTGQAGLWNGDRRRTAASNWRQPLKWNEAAKAAGERHRVFCASLADVFDNQWEPEWRADLWRLIQATPNLDWLLLTKRPQNIAKMRPDESGELNPNYLWPWPNVWLGTTVENQEEADRRIPHLLAVPAAVHFLSCEPLLGPLDLREYLDGKEEHGIDMTRPVGSRVGATVGWRPPLDWVIAGGESGAGARPAHPDWFRSLRDQCFAAGTFFHFKQWGDYAFEGQERPLGGRWIFDLAEEGFQRVGKKLAGRLLDGREHNDFPTLEAAA